MASDKKKNFEEKLRSVIETVDVANALIEPLTKSIENLLQISASQINSEEASVLVRDGEEGDLRFISAIGKVADHLINMQIPAGKGIAGFVFSSGQPMAIADVGEENSFYAEVDRQTGYSTQTLLATPLRHNGEVIGVLEYVNRIGDPPFESFSSEDMDRAAVFAEAIAAMVNAYESAKLFRDFTEKMISTDDEMTINEVRDWLKGLRDSTERREMLDLALLVREIASRGEDERRMCVKILDSILEYTQSKEESSYLNF